METSSWIAIIMFSLIILLLIGGAIWYFLEYQPEHTGGGQGGGTGSGNNAGVTGPEGSFIIQSQVDNQYISVGPSGELQLTDGSDPSQVAVFNTKPGSKGTYYVAVKNVGSGYIGNVIAGQSAHQRAYLGTISQVEKDKYVSQWKFISSVFFPANPRTSSTTNRLVNRGGTVEYSRTGAGSQKYWTLINTVHPSNN